MVFITYFPNENVSFVLDFYNSAELKYILFKLVLKYTRQQLPLYPSPLSVIIFSENKKDFR